jgi:hypothetical protein
VAAAVAYIDAPKLGNFAVSDTVLAYLGVEPEDRVRLDFVDRAGKPVSTVGEPGVYNDFRLSPDDQRVVFVRPDPRGTWQVWVLDIRSGTPTPLTDGPTYSGSPVWSGNTRIVFSRNAGFGGLAQFDVGTRATQSVAVESSAVKTPYDVSRDGRFILYGQNRFELWALPAGGSKGFQVLGVPSDQRDAQLSRDGQWLAYVSDESGSARVYVRRFSGQPSDPGTMCSVALGQQPRWGREGNELFYVASGNLMVVDIQRGATTCGAGLPRILFVLPTDALTPGGTPHGYSVTADGQRFLISRTTREAVPTSLTVILNWTVGLEK